MKKGITLIELILYVAVVSVVIFVLTNLFVLVLQTRVKNQTISNVEQEGASVMQLIGQVVRNASAINSPVPNESSGNLNLEVPTGSLNPTVFDVSGGAIRVTEGVAVPTNLTSSRVTVSNLNFQNTSRASTPNIIKVSFTVTSNSPSVKNEYFFSQNFYGSASVRKWER